ncbi:MAG: glutamate-5-semialdehyde dehydrogenase [Lentisphaeraceae bacterium]|nr:glutamate-5-semialdehyde dehydrogenase [Lentisphaeraceae bacterium]
MMSTIDFKAELEKLAAQSKKAARKLASLSTVRKNQALEAIATALFENQESIIEANALDLQAARENGLSPAMIDRLALTEERIGDMAKGLSMVAGLQDPVGKIEGNFIRPNGLSIEKVRVPIGVIGIIYESRPNVTVDAAGLCLKAGNTVILRGGKEAIHSNRKLAEVMTTSGVAAGLPEGFVTLIPWTDREAVKYLLKLDKYINLIIPRGGEGLIRYTVENSTIPVIKHYKGVCHIYVDKAANFDMARDIIINGKCQRPGVCNAVETVLVNSEIAAEFCPMIAAELYKYNVEIRADENFRKYVDSASPATEEDWHEEYLDLTVSIRVVDGIDEAMEHIDEYGSGHSDAIISDDKMAAQKFRQEVDSAAVYINASTRFTDGSMFGMGAEIGISTDRLHARGPMGLEELTTYKYVVSGTGQIRD